MCRAFEPFKFIQECARKVDVTAPTGVAALNVSGMTIHRFCGMLLGPQAGQTNEDYFNVLRRDPRKSILAGILASQSSQGLIE